MLECPQEPFAADKPLDPKPKLPPFEGPQHSPAAAKGRLFFVLSI